MIDYIQVVLIFFCFFFVLFCFFVCLFVCFVFFFFFFFGSYLGLNMWKSMHTKTFQQRITSKTLTIYRERINLLPSFCPLSKPKLRPNRFVCSSINLFRPMLTMDGGFFLNVFWFLFVARVFYFFRPYFLFQVSILCSFYLLQSSITGFQSVLVKQNKVLLFLSNTW